LQRIEKSTTEKGLEINVCLDIVLDGYGLVCRCYECGCR
jgi:hypothetical protein